MNIQDTQDEVVDLEMQLLEIMVHHHPKIGFIAAVRLSASAACMESETITDAVDLMRMGTEASEDVIRQRFPRINDIKLELMKIRKTAQ